MVPVISGYQRASIAISAGLLVRAHTSIDDYFRLRGPREATHLLWV